MNSQMDALYMKDLGHVLAAFTRAAEPDQIEASAAAFVGDGLHLRGTKGAEDQDLVVPAAQIELSRSNLDPFVLSSPRSWYWDLSTNPPALVESALSFTVAATSTAVTLTAGVPAAFAAGTKVHVLIEGMSLASPLLITVPASSASGSPITIPVPALASGSYYAIVFVPLYPITAASFTVP